MALEDKGEEMLSSVNQANVDQQQPEGNDEAEQKKWNFFIFAHSLHLIYH